jgi:hypothetical protein
MSEGVEVDEGLFSGPTFLLSRGAGYSSRTPLLRQ